MLTTLRLSASELTQLGQDPHFNPFVLLFRKFGTNYDDGSVKVNLRKPVMPDPSTTSWNKLLFNEGDCLIDMIWDTFLRAGESYKVGIGIFDELRNHVPCLVLSQAEKDFILSATSAYRSDYEGTSSWSPDDSNLLESVTQKLTSSL